MIGVLLTVTVEGNLPPLLFLYPKQLKVSNKKKKLYRTNAGMLLTERGKVKQPSKNIPVYLLMTCLHCVGASHLAFIV